MGSFEWMELQTLNTEIAAARSRLSAARVRKDQRLARSLEDEIGAAEARRARLVAQLTKQLAASGETRAKAALVEGADEPAAPDAAAPAMTLEAGAPAAGPEPANEEGGTAVWDRLTPGDIERARAEVDRRRAEMLARNAEELQRLETDEGELDGLERAIDGFARKFGLAPLEGAVVQLDAARDTRLKAAAE